jgi:hypothetical protein
MKLLIENWRKFLNEVVDLQAAQQLIDANPYLQGKLTATPENMIEGEKYILVVSDESLGHIKDRHQNASAPGSLFDPGLNLRSAMQNLLSQNPDEVSGGRVKWLGADAGAQVGKISVKLASPEEVAKMQDYTMPGGRNEVVKITAGERDSTNQISLITAELGDLSDGRKLLSLITAFPGGTEIDGKEMPFDRNEFAAAGFYFVIPQIQKESIMKTVKLTKAQLRRIIREGLDILSERSGTQLAESNVAANLKKKPEDLSDAELKEIYEELFDARKEHHAGRIHDAMLDSIEKTHGPFQEEMKKREEEKKKQKPKQEVPFSDYYMDQMSNYY